MPSWGMHLKAAKELNKKFNLDMDNFLFGSLLPDTDQDWSKRRFYTHYYGKIFFENCPCETKIDIDEFLNDYKDKLNNDLILGYYCHLLLDNYYNNYIYSNKWVLNEKGELIGYKTYDDVLIKTVSDSKTAMRHKHKDLELYSKKLLSNEKLVLPKNSKKIEKSIGLLKDNFLTIKNVEDRIYFLNNDFIELNKLSEEEIEEYDLFTEKELDKLLNSGIKYLEKEIIKLNVK